MKYKGYRLIQTNGRWFGRDQGHSWGGFDTLGDIKTWIDTIDKEDRASAQRMSAARVRSARRIKEEDADFRVGLRARLETDRALYPPQEDNP